MKILIMASLLLISLEARSADIPSNLDMQKRIEALEADVSKLKAEVKAAADSKTMPTKEEINKGMEENVKRFNMLAKFGPSMDSCILAKSIANLYLQLVNEPEFKKWKTKSLEECKKAGFPN